MPELPEVQTTVDGLNKLVKGRKIVDVTTDYNSSYYKGKEEVKNPIFFKKFKRIVRGKRIIKAERRAKNILIHLSGAYTILVHMKMTGHFVYNKPATRFVRLDFKLGNNKHLQLSDMRKFAKVTIIKTIALDDSQHLKRLGPEPLDNKFTYSKFKSQIQKRGQGKIKQILMDQGLIAGIGNIYADEILWRAGVHPLSRLDRIPENKLGLIFTSIKILLRKGIDLGGDSMDDYRNINGEKGEFQEHHKAYQKNKSKCLKKGCRGVIEKIKVGGRGTHFCMAHQKLFK
jgi:formamidopyrimidine-DNA glycosylase